MHVFRDCHYASNSFTVLRSKTKKLSKIEIGRIALLPRSLTIPAVADAFKDALDRLVL